MMLFIKTYFTKSSGCLLIPAEHVDKPMCYKCSFLSWVLHLYPTVREEFLSQIEGLNIKPIVERRSSSLTEIDTYGCLETQP
jgi:hypothetical protein